jgi:predicted acetyltransferase
MTPLLLVQYGLLSFPFKVGFTPFVRLVKSLIKLDDIYHEIMGETPHCHLQFIGTHLQHQGNGYGSQLIRSYLRLIDVANLQCYVENSNPKNNTFYERLGFEIKRQFVYDSSYPPISMMVRNPQTPPPTDSLTPDELERVEALIQDAEIAKKSNGGWWLGVVGVVVVSVVVAILFLKFY